MHGAGAGNQGETESRQEGRPVGEASPPLNSRMNSLPGHALKSQSPPTYAGAAHPPSSPSAQGSRPGSRQLRLVREWLVPAPAASPPFPSPSRPEPPCVPSVGSPHSVSLHALYSPSRLQPWPACRDLGAGERRNAGPGLALPSSSRLKDGLGGSQSQISPAIHSWMKRISRLDSGSPHPPCPLGKGGCRCLSKVKSAS